MKKHISIVAIVALVLALAAGQALAAQTLYPQSMNSSAWWFTGFQVSKAGDSSAIFNGDLVTGAEYGPGADPNNTGISGNVSAQTSGGSAPVMSQYTNFFSEWNLGNNVDENGVPGLVKLDASPVGYWMVQTTGGSFMGISSENFSDGKTAVDGVNFATLMKSQDASAELLAGTTWYYYGLAYGAESPDYRFGKIEFDKDGGIKLVLDSLNDAAPTKWDTADVSFDGGKLSITADGTSIIDGGVVGANLDIISGVTTKAAGNFETVIMVAANSKRVDTSGTYLKGKGLRLIGAGYGPASCEGTLASLFVDTDDVVTGEGSLYGATGTTAKDYTGYSFGWGSGKPGNSSSLPQTKVTFKTGGATEAEFYGSWTPDQGSLIGLYISLEPLSLQLAAFVPGVTSAGLIDPNDPTIVNPDWNIDSTTLAREYHVSVGASADQLHKIANVNKSFVPTGGTYAYDYAISNVDADGAMAIVPLELSGLAINKIDNLILYLMDIEVTPGGGLADRVKTMTYKEDPTNNLKSGSWWITDTNGAVLTKDSALDVAEAYRLFIAVRDGSKWDWESDPDSVGGIVTLGSRKKSTGSSSSGCVYNPVAGFGIEWLLLLIAPALAVVRNRFKN